MNFLKKTKSDSRGGSRETLIDVPKSPAELAIGRGDAARDSGNWELAAEEYSAALAHDQSLAGIWVQLGHALKESDKHTHAAQAYERALLINPSDVETYVHAGHVQKNLGHRLAALRHLLTAFRNGLASIAEKEEIRRLLQTEIQESGYSHIRALLEELDTFPLKNKETDLVGRLRAIIDQSSNTSAEIDAPAAIVFDVSDLVAFWGNARLPTGIQRVQIEAITAKLSADIESNVLLCCFVEGRDDWLGIPIDRFQKIVKLATSAGDTKDPEWLDAISDLRIELSVAMPFSFPVGSTLINLGTSWWIQNYFLYVRHAKVARNVQYIPFVHDMIPIMAPEHCTNQLTRDFISWALGVFDHADHFLANSEATKRDLLSVAENLGHTIAPSDVAVIPLNSDFRKPEQEVLSSGHLAEWGLEEGQFTLFVSTIESRKGHLFALEAWSRLIEKHGLDRVPKLVCVGNRGWLNDEVYARLESDRTLSETVVMLSKLSDAELALLYRTCRFTIYPSLYEGWGLPVTESLCYGKVPLISDAASLPEAGGDLAVYAAAGSVDELEDKAEQLIVDASVLTTLEQRIRKEFSPRTWSDVAGQIVQEIENFGVLDQVDIENSVKQSDAPAAHLGCWHPMTRNEATRIWRGMRSAEIFRSNLNWYWPEDRGCRVKKGGGQLSFQILSGHQGLQLMVQLRGDEHAYTEYEISCGGTRTRGFLSANEVKWDWLELPACVDAATYVVDIDAGVQAGGLQPTYFVCGFFVQENGDDDSKQSFKDALLFGRLDLLDAFREQDHELSPNLAPSGEENEHA